jgi:diguanylate cyclase (GGDEF)-like protein
MQQELPFPGYHELIKVPLEATDPASLKRINNLFLEMSGIPVADPFSLLVKKLTGRSYADGEAQNLWKAIIEHKNGIESKLERAVTIQTAAVDYLSLEETGKRVRQPSFPSASADVRKKPDPAEEWLHRVYAPGYHMERLRDEMMRSKRYNHALAAIMVDVDAFHRINEQASYEAGDSILRLLVKIIKSNIRAVDIIARYSGDRFLVILPSTNKREAFELADRLRLSIAERTKHAKGCNGGVTVTLSVGQCSKEDQSLEYMKKLETTLENGKKKERNTVYEF